MIMAYMTEAEADRLDELYTETTPEINVNKPGIFSQQKARAVFLDEFTARYLTGKALTTKKTPGELIADMVQNELKAAQ